MVLRMRAQRRGVKQRREQKTKTESIAHSRFVGIRRTNQGTRLRARARARACARAPVVPVPVPPAVARALGQAFSLVTTTFCVPLAAATEASRNG